MAIRALSLLLLLPSMATAQGLGPDAPAAAQQRYDIGRQLYRDGDYAGAAREFKVALKLHETPRLAYNLARSLERSDEIHHAIEAYETYLRLAPGAEDAQQVRATIAALREAHPTPEPEAEAADGTSARPAEASNPWPWVAFGVGAVGLGAGVYFATRSSAALDDRDASIDAGEGRTVVEGHQDDAEGAQTLGIVGWSLAAVGVAAGVTLLLLDDDDGGDVALQVGPGAVGLSARW